MIRSELLSVVSVSLSLVLGQGCGGELSGPTGQADAGAPAADADLLSTERDSGAPAPDQAPEPPPPPPPPPPPEQPPPPVPPNPNGPKVLPQATQPCPQIREGELTILGAKVQVWVDPTNNKPGPLVFYWHGTGSSPLEVMVGLGIDAVGEIKARGGMVVAPRGPTGKGGSQTGGIVWTSGDMALADEILACAFQQVGIDTARIHSMGLSAGGLHTTVMSYSRAGYLASVASFSGGLVPILPPPASQLPSNKLAAMIVHGGEGDQLNWFSFKESSQKYHQALRGAGHFALLCDHGQGHTIPPNAASAYHFFLAHPWGTAPSPYASGLPGGLPGTCTP